MATEVEAFTAAARLGDKSPHTALGCISYLTLWYIYHEYNL